MSDFGEILKAVGEFGPFQKRLLVLICLPNFFMGLHLLAQVFTGANVQHFCQTNWILNISAGLAEEEKLFLTLPEGRNGSYQQCKMYKPNPDKDIDWIRLHGSQSTVACEEGWVYDTSQYTSTLVTEFDLVCDANWLNQLSRSCSMFGLFAGALLFGPLADRFGRRPIVLLSLLLQLVSGVGAAFVPNFNLFIALQFVVGASVSGILINTFVLGTEWSGVSQRTLATVLSHCAFAGGQIVLAGLAYGIRDWRMLQLTISCPMALFFSYIWVLPESARWLVTKGHYKAAKKHLMNAARINKRVVPETLLDKIMTEKEIHQATLLDLFKTPRLRRVTLILISIWFINSFVYYGLAFNVQSFGTNIYLTQLIFGLVDMLRGFCIWLLNKFGRKKCQGGFLLLCGISCLLMLAFPEGMQIGVTILAVFAKLGISCSFSTAYVYSAELFPTVVRQTGIGLVSMSARIGGIITPMIALLQQDYPALPMALYGTALIVLSALCALLPETVNKELPDQTREMNSKNDLENGHNQTVAENGNLIKKRQWQNTADKNYQEKQFRMKQQQTMSQGPGFGQSTNGISGRDNNCRDPTVTVLAAIHRLSTEQELNLATFV
ncbi:solute carrier family 22 member 13b [Carcharodon carcharias]|uniref:solute carrier family 22 member 13b n=1 Tax=Carcharodon carcharias TaxID=13397 RepID=UPI001B7EA9BF|nr:solute carrier family 22 member 13b [Carcharodon carcharias]